MPTYELLSTVRHEDYDADYWLKIRTLYQGAKTMRDVLKTPGPLREMVFPRNLGETDDVYDERCKRACYSPHMTQLIDYILSVLFSDPVEMTAGGEGEDVDPGSVDPFYDDFFKNTSRPGGHAVTFNQLLRDLAKGALLYKRSWVLIDFPQAPKDPRTGERVAPANRAQEEDLGLDRAYCVTIDPELVLDWEHDEDDGELSWVMIHDVKRRRDSVEQKRNMVKETFTVYDREGWTRYVWEYDSSKSKPQPGSQPTATFTGKHTFGRVPVLPIEVPEGLWAGGKLESLAIEIFNARSALSWGRNRSLFQMIVAKLSNPDPLNPVTEDPDRGFNQTVGAGRVITMAEKDSYEYVSPDAAPFAEAREDIKDLVDDMHRVLHQLAQSAGNSASKQKQSGESKGMDMAAGAVVSKELGRIFRDVATVIYTCISNGRKDDTKDWNPKGLSEFDDVSLDDFVTEAVALETVPIPSPLFQTLYKYDLAQRLLPGATIEQLDTIYDELEASHVAEGMLKDATNEAMIDDPLGQQAAADAAAAAPAGEGKPAKGAPPAPKAPPKKGPRPPKSTKGVAGDKPKKSPRRAPTVK